MSWDLLQWCPEAAVAAHGHSPVVVIWHFQLDDTPDQLYALRDGAAER
jgi:hypothetical protein